MTDKPFIDIKLQPNTYGMIIWEVSSYIPAPNFSKHESRGVAKTYNQAFDDARLYIEAHASRKNTPKKPTFRIIEEVQ